MYKIIDIIIGIFAAIVCYIIYKVTDNYITLRKKDVEKFKKKNIFSLLGE